MANRKHAKVNRRDRRKAKQSRWKREATTKPKIRAHKGPIVGKSV